MVNNITVIYGDSCKKRKQTERTTIYVLSPLTYNGRHIQWHEIYGVQIPSSAIFLVITISDFDLFSLT